METLLQLGLQVRLLGLVALSLSGLLGLVGLGARLNAPECDRDAPLEENGVNFSVGERIRLAVAREILTRRTDWLDAA